MTDELRPDSSAEVAVAATIDAASDPDATQGSRPSIRTGRRSILPVDTQIGRYVVRERIGAGGMGNVYRAHDPELDRDIALKFVAATDIAAAQEYLQREAQAMAKLSHRNVAVVHDIGTWSEQLFIAMELMPGGSLATWLAEPRPWREVVRRFVAAGRGLAAAHRIGLVHRDFKPDNVLIGADGTIKVSDFGLVRSSSEDVEEIEGTPAYMAPEQLSGGEVDARADQFAYAVSVWEGVFGGRPFQPEGRDPIAGMLRAIRSRRMMRSTTAKVPNRVLEILKRALDPDPGARWPSLDVLVDALERAATPSKKRWIVLGVAGAIAIAGVTATIMYVTRPARDLTGTIEQFRHALAPIYVAAGDVVRARTHNKLVLPLAESTAAVSAYDAALELTGNNELRPSLAQMLFASNECSRAIAQLDTYFRNGGKAATYEHIGGHAFEAGRGRVTRYIDTSILVQLKAECSRFDDLLATTEEMEHHAMQLLRNGEYDRAIDVIDRAYRSTGQARFFKTMGDIRRIEGNCDKAREYYGLYAANEKEASPEWLESVRKLGEECKPTQ